MDNGQCPTSVSFMNQPMSETFRKSLANFVLAILNPHNLIPEGSLVG
jgi:hypothetical protein